MGRLLLPGVRLLLVHQLIRDLGFDSAFDTTRLGAADLEARLAQGQRLTTPQIMVLLDAHKHAQPAEAAADGSGLLSTANSSALFDGLTDSCQLAASPTGLQDACIAS